MRQFFLTLAGVFAGLTLFAVAAVVFLITSLAALSSSVESSARQRVSRAVPASTVVLIDLRRSLADQSVPTLAGARPSLVSLVEALEQAEKDGRVKGAFVRASESGLDPAQAEEIHKALLSFRSHGKFVITHAQGFEATSVTSYVAASASDQIWIQPTASFSSTGLAVQTPFLGGLFAKFGVDPEFEQFYEYKNAVNTYTQTGYTKEHREAELGLLNSIFDQSVSLAAKARSDKGMTPASLRALFEKGPYSAEQSVKLGLTDKLGQVDDARKAALDKAGGDAELLDIFAYLRAEGRPYQSKSGPVIAVVSGQGDVQTGEISPSYFSSSSGVYSDTLAEAIIDASKDDDVRAIVLRVDSPGGSATASDQIWDAVTRARAAGKPVVASFGSVAASGGYYLAAGATSIVSDATTITGSIGVFGGKLVVRDAADKWLGVNVASLSVGGDYTTAYSNWTPFTPEQRTAFKGMLADVYDDFTGKVAQGRKMSKEAVDAVAHGRVWSGVDAKQRGLVDEIGGYREAIARAKQLANIPADADIRVRNFPKEPTAVEVFRSLFGVSMDDARVLSEIHALADNVGLTEAAKEAHDRLDPDMLLLAPSLTVR
jgi:protease-4